MSSQDFYKNDLMVQVPIAKLDIDDIQLIETPIEKSNLYELKELNNSLEDLVQKFEDNLNKCLQVDNYKTFDVAKIAPIQIRSEDEAMTGSQVFYTLTGNFGTLLPIDWSKSFDVKTDDQNEINNCILSTIEQNALNESLDYECNFNSINNEDLIKLSKSVFFDEPLIFTAEQVLNEIDSIIKDDYYDESSPDSGCFSDLNYDDDYAKYLETFEQKTYSYNYDNLKNLSKDSLNDLISSFEKNKKELSETLVQEYALKDELDCEYEAKNTFIYLVNSIQEKRRNFLTQNVYSNSKSIIKKRKSCNDISNMPGMNLLTNVPYHENIQLNTKNLDILNKLLTAINDDSNQVSELLTNYILNVVCL